MTKPKTKLTISEKIKLLLDLAANNSSETEASAAMEKAQDLLAKYNLSIKDVMLEGQFKKYQVVFGKVGDVFAHKRTLGVAIGKMYFCKYFYTVVNTESKGKNVYKREQHCFAGETHNLEIANMMFDYLAKTIDRLAKGAADQMEDKQRYWSFQTAFKTAASARIAGRIREKLLACTTPAKPGGNLPALASLYDRADKEISEFLESQMQLTSTPAKKQMYDAAGLQAGRAAGDSIGLDTQIGGTKDATHLLA